MLKQKKEIILQIEVRTQEEWDTLMQRRGLAVVDVYSNWCGPCKAILSLFRKIRNEQQDDVLFFATADTDSIDSLADYRGKSQPTFLFYGDGQLVNVMRGCNGPLITKLINTLVRKERQIAEGIFDREIFIDKVVCKEPEAEEKQDIAKEQRDEGEEELVPKEVTVVIIKPDAVQADVVEQIAEEVVGAGYEILQKIERLLTKEEVAELYRQDEGDSFEQLIEFMTSGPCVALAVSKAGDVIGEEIVSEFMTLAGPTDVNTAKEEAPESLRAKFGTDSLHNAIHCSMSVEDVSRELAFFFPDLEIPTVQHLIQQKNLQRTLALIRPNALGRKNSILKTIEDRGFVIAIQKEIEFTKEQAEEFYSQQKDEELYESLITNMTSGPSVALCLVKNNAIQVWKDMLAPKEIVESTEDDENEEEQEVSLQVKFGVAEDTCEPLHAADTIKQFEREMKILFPIQNAVVVIQPDTYKNDDERGTIMSKLKQAGFNIVSQKEVTMTTEQASFLYKENTDKEYFEELIQYMSSGPSQFSILSREDAIDGLHILLGPAHPEEAKEMNPNSLRGQFGIDEVRNAVYGSTTKEGAMDVIKEFFADIEFDENGLVSEVVPCIEETEELVGETNQPDAVTNEGGETNAEPPQSPPAVQNDVAATDQPVAETEVVTEGDTTEPSLEPTSDGQIESTGTAEVGNEPLLGSEAENTDSTEVNKDPPVDGQTDANASDEVSREQTLDGPTTDEPMNSSVQPSREPTTDGPTDDNSPVQPSREPTTDGPTDDNSSVQPSREPTTDGQTEDSTSIEVSREGTLNETNAETSDTTTSNTDTETA